MVSQVNLPKRRISGTFFDIFNQHDYVSSKYFQGISETFAKKLRLN